MLRVSSGFQTLENNKTTRPAASWFQMFSRVWKPDETLALVFEIVHKDIIMEKSELQSTCCGQFVLKLTLQGLFTEESREA